MLTGKSGVGLQKEINQTKFKNFTNECKAQW